MTESALAARLKLQVMSARTLGVSKGGPTGRLGGAMDSSGKGPFWGSKRLICTFDFLNFLDLYPGFRN